MKDISNLSPAKRALLARLLKQKGREYGTFPLSHAQSRLWYLDQLSPGHFLYNIPLAARFSGRLDVGALERALDAMVRRHDALRTVFTAIDGEPVQIVKDAIHVPLELEDLSRLPEDAWDAAVEERIREHGRRPFDLARGPLIRVTLVRLSATEHALISVLHHIIADGWSLGVIGAELSALYADAVEGRASAMPPLPIQYPDYTLWQRSALQGEALSSLLDHWRAKLAGVDLAPGLPTDRPRPAVQAFRGVRRIEPTAPELCGPVHELCRAEGVTLFMLTLAAFRILLGRYTGRDDLVIGSPVANRPRVELEGLIGFFVNMLLLRVDAGGDPTFLELLRRVRSATLDAYAHQELPFELLVKELRPERFLNHQPAFQAGFAVQSSPIKPIRLPGVTMTPIEIDNGVAHFDLMLSIADRGERLLAIWEYDTDLFDHETVTRMARRYEGLLGAAVRDPMRPISALPLMDAGERRRVLELSESGPRAAAPPRSIQGAFEAQAARAPEAVAIVDGEERWSYAELDARADRIARRLRGLGVGRGGRVAVCAERPARAIAGALGALKAGAAYVPLDPAEPPARLRELLDAAAPDALLAEGHRLARLGGAPVALALDAGSLDAAPEEVGPLAPIDAEQAAEAIACVLFAPDATARDGEIRLPHAAVTGALGAGWPGLDPSDVVAQLGRPGSAAQLVEVWGALLAGARLSCAPPSAARSARGLAARLRKERVTALVLPTERVAPLTREAPGALGGLRLVIALGGALPPAWASGAARPARLVQAQVDLACGGAFAWSAESDPVPGAALVVRPTPGARILVLDRRLELAPLDVPGELWAGGPGLACEDPGRAARAPDPLDDDPRARLQRTGVRGRLRRDGGIELLGRIDERVVLDGSPVALARIEAALAEHLAVRACAVILGSAADEGRPVAYVVPAAGAQDEERGDDALAAEHLLAWEREADEASAAPAAPGAEETEAEAQAEVEATAARVLACRPRRVLEIGCGDGGLLLAVAPRCASYQATDVSARAVARLRERIAAEGALGHVSVARRAPDDLGDVSARSVDTLVIGPSLERFPSLELLVGVLESAASTVEDSGRIVVAGVLDLDLLEALPAERRLLVRPDVFRALAGRIRRVSAVEIHPHRARGDGARMRYDVILHLGAQPGSGQPTDPQLDWPRCPATTPLHAPGRGRLGAYLRAFLEARLPEPLIPARVVLLDRLPTTERGAIDRAALPEAARARSAPAAPVTAPRTPTEQLVHGVWRALLGRDEIGIDQKFFEIGGDSLLIVRMFSLLRERFPDRISIADLFDNPTIRAIAARLDLGAAPADAAEGIEL